MRRPGCEQSREWKFPMNRRIPPLNIKIMLGSNPPKSGILVRRLAVLSCDTHTPTPAQKNIQTSHRTVRSDNINSQNFKLRILIPRTIAYVHPKRPIGSSNIPGAGSNFPDNIYIYIYIYIHTYIHIYIYIHTHMAVRTLKAGRKILASNFLMSSQC